MRPKRLLAALLAATALTGWGVRDDGPEWPHSGPMPDNPIKVRPLRYESIGRGAQSYRPIAPMPWGDVNRRVAPPGSLPGAPPAKKGSAAPAPTQIAVPSPIAPVLPAAPVSPAVAPAIPAPPVPVIPVIPGTPTPMPILPVVPPAGAPGHGTHGAPPAAKQ